MQKKKKVKPNSNTKKSEGSLRVFFFFLKKKTYPALRYLYLEILSTNVRA